MQKVYVVFGCINHDGDYVQGVFSTLEKAIEKGRAIANDQDKAYDDVEVRETMLDNPSDESWFYWQKVWSKHQ